VGDNAILLGELEIIAKNFPSAQLNDVGNYSSAADCFFDEAHDYHDPAYGCP
jgi:hypothetical protein